MPKPIRSFLFVCVLLSLAACGGGGGGGSDSGGGGNTVDSFSVVVQPGGSESDTEQAEALLVRLGNGGQANAFALGDGETPASDLFGDVEILQVGRGLGNGAFRFDWPEGGVDGLVVLVRQVRDGRFTVGSTVEFYAPLSLYDVDGEETVTVNPLTTLALLRAGSADAGAVRTALDTVMAAFGVESPDDPRAALPILAALSLVEYFPDWPSRLAANVGGFESELQALDPESVPESFRGEFELRRDVALAVFEAGNTLSVEAFTAAVNEIEFARRAALILDRAGTTYADGYLDRLADAVIDALGGASAGGGQGAGNILRYVINEYRLGDDLADAGADVPAAIRGDSVIPELAARGSAIPVSVPLLEGELLGLDSDRRRQYYLQTELAPSAFVSELFAEVTDANVTDQAQAALAESAARHGRPDEARFLADTQIFGTAAQATAFRNAGDRLAEIGDETHASEFFYRALELYEGLIATKGITNLSQDDIIFLQYLIGDAGRGFVRLGDSAGAERAAEPLDTFIEQEGSGAFNSAVSRALVSLSNLAGDLVEQAAAANLQDTTLNAAAESAVDRLVEVTDSVELYVSGNSRSCSEYYSDGEVQYLVRGIQYRSAVRYYEQLDLKDKAVAVVTQRLPELRNTDYESCRLETYFDDFVVSLTRLGATDTADQLIASMVDDDYRDDAISAAELASATVARDAGEIEEAVNIVMTEITGSDRPIEIMAQLLYYNSLAGNRGIAGYLVDRGEYAQAKIALDAAYDYYRGAEFADYADSVDSDQAINTWLIFSGSRIAELYAKAGYEAEADQVLAELESVVADKLSQNASRRSHARRYMGLTYMYTGRGDQARSTLAEARSQALTLPLGEEARVDALWHLVDAYLELGGDYQDGFLETVADARAAAAALCCEGVGSGDLAEAREDRADWLVDIASDYVEAVYRLRERLWRAQVDGQPVATIRERLRRVESEAVDLMTEAADAVFEVPTASARVTDLTILLAAMTHLDLRDDIREVLVRVTSAPDRNELQVEVAHADLGVSPYSERSDFPVYALQNLFPPRSLLERGPVPASVDTDDDGLPDFYDPVDADPAAFGLALDTDIDNDGVDAGADYYPLDAQRW